MTQTISSDRCPADGGAVFDGHADLLWDAARRRARGETHVLERRHLDRLHRGGVEGLVLAVWAEAPDYAADTRRQMEALRAEMAESGGFTLVRTAREAEAVRAEGRVYVFLAIEGMAAIGGNPEGIDRYAEAGARLGMLTWNEENALASGAGGDPVRGLSALGRQAVRRMEERGMRIDVSHLNDGGFWDVMRLAEGPIIASHSNCRALCPVPRNLTDSQLRAIRDTGGIVGLNAYCGFVHREPALQTAETLARHAAHMAEVMGAEHVACGFDFCGYMGPGNESAAGLEDASKIPDFFTCLEQFGFSEAERRMIARENFLRVLA